MTKFKACFIYFFNVKVKKGEGLTLLHAAHVAKLSLVLAILASAGARLKPILLTDGARAALWGRSMRKGEIRHRLV